MLTTLLTVLGALALFGAGLWLSAFFSGSETGFYRASPLRLNIDAHGGDPIAARLQWFSRNPSHFVATTLVGNNVANYLTTLAIGMAGFAVFPRSGGSTEILLTIALSPVVFVFGELIPKNLYYRAPLMLLRQRTTMFMVFHRLFLIVSVPLMLITKLIERFSPGKRTHGDLILGRSRLVQVLTQGHREGILTDVQSRLVQSVMLTATDSVVSSMTPVSRILGVSEDVSRDEALAYARQFGLTQMAVRRANTESDWFGCVRVVDLSIKNQSVKSMLYDLPSIDAKSTKLEALLALRKASTTYGAVFRENELLGTVSERGLTEQLFRLPHARS